MELTNTPMSERQTTYRKIYRERINGWYNGYLHVAMIYAIGGLSMLYYAAHLDNIRWWEWLIVPIVFLASNFFEWWLHTEIMHRPQRAAGARAIYQRHTLQHHQFFTNTEMRFADQRDDRIHHDVDSGRAGPELAGQPQRGLVVHLDHHRDVPDL